jgi:ABC-type nitrate/sulfonate/bicarbonate transport system permease component
MTALPSEAPTMAVAPSPSGGPAAGVAMAPLKGGLVGGRRLGGLIGIVAVFALWEVLALSLPNARFVLPTPLGVAEQMWRDRQIYAQNVPTTLWEASLGWIWGNLVAIALAVATAIFPVVERPLMKLALVTYCMPIIAIGPLLQIMLSGRSPEISIAAISVFFTTLVGCMAGLRSVDRTSLDLVHAYGGGTWAKFIKLRAKSAMPSAFAGLRIAGPAAILGAIIGEYLGAEQGLGVAMVNSMQSLDVASTWGLAIVAAAIAGAAYGITALIGNLLTPWREPVTYARAERVRTSIDRGRGAGAMVLVAKTLGYVALSVALVAGLWYGLFAALHLNPYFAKTPSDIVRYLFVGPGAAANRTSLQSGLAITMRDAALGYGLGTVCAIVAAAGVVLQRGVERAVMPVAISLRSVPLIAMTPLIALEFGRGLLSVAIVAGLVTFFPSLVNFVFGLKSAPDQWVDLLHACGAGQPAVLRKIRLPYALPSFFAAARIAAPGAVLGAVLAEWLVSGNGLGYMMLVSSQNSDYNFLWSGVLLITTISILIYNLVSFVESRLLTRYWS